MAGVGAVQMADVQFRKALGILSACVVGVKVLVTYHRPTNEYSIWGQEPGKRRFRLFPNPLIDRGLTMHIAGALAAEAGIAEGVTWFTGNSDPSILGAAPAPLHKRCEVCGGPVNPAAIRRFRIVKEDREGKEVTTYHCSRTHMKEAGA